MTSQMSFAEDGHMKNSHCEMFLNPLGYMCHCTINIFFQTAKLVFSLIGKVLCAFYLMSVLPSFFF